MGVIKQGILGGVSGKVGTVIGGSWKGISYLRSRAQSIANPQTLRQNEQRTKFKLVLDFLKPFTNLLAISYKSKAIKQTAFNAAMSYHVKNAVIGAYPNYEIDFPNTLMSVGNLQPVANATVISANPGYVEFEWEDNSGYGNASPDDVLNTVLYYVIKSLKKIENK